MATQEHSRPRRKRLSETETVSCIHSNCHRKIKHASLKKHYFVEHHETYTSKTIPWYHPLTPNAPQPYKGSLTDSILAKIQAQADASNAEYIKDMRDHTTFATQIELLMLHRIYKIDIVIYDSNFEEKCRFRCNDNGILNPNNDMIELVHYHDLKHYDLICKSHVLEPMRPDEPRKYEHDLGLGRRINHV